MRQISPIMVRAEVSAGQWEDVYAGWFDDQSEDVRVAWPLVNAAIAEGQNAPMIQWATIPLGKYQPHDSAAWAAMRATAGEQQSNINPP